MVSRIEICGGTAVGKTTLAALLEDIGVSPSYEKFAKVPFWKEFYTDPGRFAFETEIGFLLQHYHQIKLAAESGRMVVCDFSFIQDRAYAEVDLRGSQREAFLSVYDEILRELGEPQLVVHLKCSETEQIRRIKVRARDGESMKIDFLTNVNAAIARFVPSSYQTSKLIEIDSESVNFSDKYADKESIRCQIKTALNV